MFETKFIDVAALQAWIGRSESTAEVASSQPIAGLAAILDYASPPWPPGELPPLAHWLYFLPRYRESSLDIDGHAKSGAFVPPVPLPRRMWAGSRVRFLTPIPVGAGITRHSRIAQVAGKRGRSGDMVFVTVHHEIFVGDTPAITEEQDIVYLPAATAATPEPLIDGRAATARVADATRSRSVDAVQLFRFSALTFNAHRIHYDRVYARDSEGYPGLVVHGPLLATLLMDHFLRETNGAHVNAFEFRARRPLFDTDAFDLCLAWAVGGADLWIVDATGQVMLTARAERA
jgi:3-methylfumaryl-CoA hydratase